jgi:hypothetical protein
MSVAAVAVAVGTPSAAVGAAPGAGAAPPRPRDIDEQFAAIAQNTPSFGGMYLDEERDVLYVHSWDSTPGASHMAEQAVRAVFGDKHPGSRIQVVLARYGFQELKQWEERMAPGVLAVRGVVETDIDDRSNRLTVGIESADEREAVEERLAELGIPGEAVNIVETPAVTQEVSLQGRLRPTVGGLQIAFSRSGATYMCTESLNVVRAGVAGYVTNSHCTAQQGGSTATPHHQPSISSTTNRIGVEWVDPAYFTGSSCPAGRRCRRSDSAFGRRDGGVTASQGRIARPTLFNTISWDGTSTFRIVREADPIVGQVVTKVGRTTGRTTGTVTETCVNYNVSGTDITQLCQSRASYASAAGDSGSPVFRVVDSPATNDVALGGIHWGSGGVFSTISNIQRSVSPVELGSMTTCASGFSC